MKTIEKNYTIAVCDILGFKNLVQERPVSEVVQHHMGWLSRSLYHSIHKDGFPDNIPSLSQLRAQSKVGVAWFSDTIMMYTLEDSDNCLRELISAVAWLLFETMFTPATRIRCGISYGEAHLDVKNAIFVGRPIADAYLLEQDQAWSGGALTREAVERVPKSYRDGNFPANWPVVPYDVPLKTGGKRSNLAINWTIGLHHPSPPFRLWSAQSENPTPSDCRLNRDICEKFMNTRTFHDKVCSGCRLYSK